ncbi:hypothetical protein CF065_18855 [Clostridium sporogenes]
MKILENNFATFTDLLKEYERLKSKKASLERKKKVQEDEEIKGMIDTEIVLLQLNIEKMENSKLYTEKGINNMKAWKEV